MKNLKLYLIPSILNLTLCFIMACSTKPPSIDKIEQGDLKTAASHMDSFIAYAMKQSEIPGLAIVVVNKDGPIFSKGFGVSIPSTQKLFTDLTISNIGSVSKLFTGMAILTLVDKGLLDLDAPITKYLPEFKIKAQGFDPAKITTRLLLMHHAGIQNDIFDEFQSSVKPADYPYPYRKVPQIMADSWLVEEPGTLMSYSNLGYSLLGNMVERLSKKDFNDYISETIYKPLGMVDSSFLQQTDKLDRIAMGPSAHGNVNIPFLRDMPAGAMTSTAADMGKFMQAIINNGKTQDKNLISAEIFKEMISRQNSKVPRDLDMSIGLTWFLTKSPNLPTESFIGHDGDVNPFHASLKIDMERQIGVFILVNSINGPGSSSLEDISNEAIKTFTMADKGIELQTKASKAPLKIVKGDKSLLGNYASQLGFVKVRTTGDQLQMQLLGNWLDMVQYEDQHIELKAYFLGIEIEIPFLKAVSISIEKIGNESVIATHLNGELFDVMTKLNAESIPKIWGNRVGTWTFTKPSKDAFFDSVSLSIDQETGLMLLTAMAQGQNYVLPVSIIDDTHIKTSGHGRNLGMICTILPGDQEELEFAGVRFIKKK